MPDWGQHIRPRLSALRLSPAREAEIVDELAQHLEERWREWLAGGASETEATRLAREYELSVFSTHSFNFGGDRLEER